MLIFCVYAITQQTFRSFGFGILRFLPAYICALHHLIWLVQLPFRLEMLRFVNAISAKFPAKMKCRFHSLRPILCYHTIHFFKCKVKRKNSSEPVQQSFLFRPAQNTCCLICSPKIISIVWILPKSDTRQNCASVNPGYVVYSNSNRLFLTILPGEAPEFH